MDKKWMMLLAMCGLLFAAILMGILRSCERREPHGQSSPQVKVERRTERVVKTDTVYIDRPVAVMTERIRTDTVVLVRVPEMECPILTATGIEEDSDVVAVEVPVEQTLYQDSTYRAWVSGFHARLDSIEVYSRQETIRETVEITKSERRRWGFTVGPQLGAGWNGRGITPFIGIGISWGYSF